MTLDGVFRKRFLVAWKHSATVRQVARRLGDCLTAGEVRRVARRLRLEGVDLSRRPEGPGLLGYLYLFGHPDGCYQDLRGRDAYRVGAGTMIEGPWDCARCGSRVVRGFCVVGRQGHRFVCRKCVRVVN
jgi:hypothetical protein